MTIGSPRCPNTLNGSASLRNGQKHSNFVKISTCKPFYAMFSALFSLYENDRRDFSRLGFY
jgi:hypothetical protein